MTFSTIITKSLFTPWKLGSIRKSKYLFCTWFVILGRYLFQLIVLLKLDSNYLRSFIFSWVDIVTTGRQSLVSFTWNLWSWFDAVPATRIPILDHFNWRLISQLIKGISNVLQNYLDILVKPLFQHLLCDRFVFVLLFAV